MTFCNSTRQCILLKHHFQREVEMLRPSCHRKDHFDDEFGTVNFTVFVGSFIESTERLRKVSHGSLGLPRHFSHGLVFGEQISRRGQRWSNTNHDINLQLKFEFSNVQHHNLYHVEGFWQSSTCCMNHPYSRCGQVSILKNPRMAWKKESHGKRQLERRSLICKLL